MPSKTQSILLGGAVVGVAIALFGFIPVVGQCLVCLGVIGAGMLAVWHYANTYRLTIAGGPGAGMGALAGVVAAIVDGIISFLFSVLGLTVSMQEAMQQALEGMQRGGMPPEQLEVARQVLESPWLLPGAFVCGLIIYAVVGAIGGAVGASLFQQGSDGSDGDGSEGVPVAPREPSAV